MNYFDRPEIETPFNFISLGAGVQSSTMALMAAKGLITPMPQAAIFADTQAEPKSVYTWLDWLVKQLPFPTHIGTYGNLIKDTLTIHYKKKSGEAYVQSLAPAYTYDSNGKPGMMPRQCTKHYKAIFLEKIMRRFAKVKYGQKHVTVTSWIGITIDEIQRVKDSRVPWMQKRYPLIEMEMTRKKCLDWMSDNGFPNPPRSACVHCPFHSNQEWRDLKENEPQEFARAVAFDHAYREAKLKTTKTTPFIHQSRVPLDQVDLSTDEERGQLTLWQNECEGMCGV